MTADKPEKKRKKSGTQYWVITEEGAGNGTFKRHYSGSAKQDARDKAAKLLSGEAMKSSPDEDLRVIVAKVAKVKILSYESLKASLPKDAF
jgi:hypothetical protein